MKIAIRPNIRLSLIQSDASYCLIATDQSQQFFHYGVGQFESDPEFGSLMNGFGNSKTELFGFFSRNKLFVHQEFSGQKGSRYSRQKSYYASRFKNLDAEKLQAKVEQAKCAVVGVGGIGCHVADQLARIGVREIVLVDHDRVEPSNLNRQVLYEEQDVGREKTHAAENRLKNIRRSLDVSTFPDVASFLKKCDVSSLGAVFVSADESQLALRATLSRTLYPKGIFSVYVGYNGHTAMIGPCTMAGVMGCGACAANLSDLDGITKNLPHMLATPASAYSINAIAASIAVETWLSVNAIENDRPFTIEFSMETLTAERKEVQLIEGCPVCG
ncbi:HesA/MoeB/ThiF family protein [Pseudooceanicola atlanticus]|uniref:HesA/MoeB/ThiF family protein n=1 Tax=Pseudooceanicola atlanticus TaxID=1461694 RepID=UPI0009DF2297|nr:ThiF family adenylyltransferase [Pseudooceanicola atlanticus]